MSSLFKEKKGNRDIGALLKSHESLMELWFAKRQMIR